ncbi:MAG TPA: diiron oxygenase [Rhizobacter sp.]|nr:diiron oxygenase [Rhizobacter sp.]
METASQIAVRLSKASCKKFYDVYNSFDWPAELQEGAWCMPPELISLYGTPAYEALDEPTRQRLSLYELANLFSLVLQGERLLVQGLAHRLYSTSNNREITEYLHHFLDEENKHMVMFGEFCHRYAGKVYPEKKLALPREYAKGEEEVVFFCMAMVVEELGDYYNVLIGRDERVDPLVREINRFHHVDEARHLAFGRLYLAELFERYAPHWSAQSLAGFRRWLADYLKASWADYYNPAVYRDAGIADAYDVRQMALAHPATAQHRRQVTDKLMGYFIKVGLLTEAAPL